MYSSLQRNTHQYQYYGAIQCGTGQYCGLSTDLFVAGTRIYVGTDAYVSVHIFTLWYGASRVYPCWHRPGVVKGTCLYPRPNQVIYLLPIGGVVGYFPSGHSCVWPFSFWTQPYKGIFLLDASGRHVSWHHAHASCQGAEHRCKYSLRIPKHAADSRHSDSIQFYSLYLMYIYICYYHTSRSQHKHPASRPSPRSSSNTVLM